MTRSRLAQVLTVSGVAGLLAVVVVRSSVVSRPAESVREPTPQDAVYAMFDAARGGDSGAYLDAFAGPLQVQLRQTAAEQGADSFARSLKETNGPVKGIAVGEPERVTTQEVRVRVELVYADHNEAQWFFLERQPDSRWKIVRLDAAARIPTSRRYGAPVD